MAAPIRVAVTGAAGQIGYALLFRMASGEMLGPDQPVIIQGLELPFALDHSGDFSCRADDGRRLSANGAKRCQRYKRDCGDNNFCSWFHADTCCGT